MSADFAHLTQGALNPPVAPSALYWGAFLLFSSLLKLFHSGTLKGRKLPEQNHTAKYNLMLEQSVILYILGCVQRLCTGGFYIVTYP